MSDLSELQRRAVEIRQKYDEHEQRKLGRTWTNEELAMGFIGDVGDLMKLIMAKEGIREIAEDVDDKLAHELSDCLWSILVIADKYNVKLEQAFSETMQLIEARLMGEA